VKGEGPAIIIDVLPSVRRLHAWHGLPPARDAVTYLNAERGRTAQVTCVTRGDGSERSGSRLLKVCRPPSIAWYFSTASSRSCLVGKTVRITIRVAAPSGAKVRTDSKAFGSSRGLTVQQRDPLRRDELGPGDPLGVVRPVRPVHHEVPGSADAELEGPGGGGETFRTPPPRQVPDLGERLEHQLWRGVDDPGDHDLPIGRRRFRPAIPDLAAMLILPAVSA
jgi:hypothetical protein